MPRLFIKLTGPSFFCAPPFGSLRAERSRTLRDDGFLRFAFVGLMAMQDVRLFGADDNWP